VSPTTRINIPIPQVSLEVCLFGHWRYGTPDFGVPPSASVRGVPIWPLGVWYTGFRCAAFCLCSRCADLAMGGMVHRISVCRLLPLFEVRRFGRWRYGTPDFGVPPSASFLGVPIWPRVVWLAGFRSVATCLKVTYPLSPL